MQPASDIQGIHHITAITSAATENLSFYRQVLGLRLVKKTVNFDDPYTYHFYFGDGIGSPGTILTFFAWERMPRGKAGAGMVAAVAFAIDRSSVDFWQDRLTSAKLEVRRQVRFDEPVLQFQDPHGLVLELIGVSRPVPVTLWEESAIAGSHAIRGFHSATQWTRRMDGTRTLLVETMGMVLEGAEGPRCRFRMTDVQAPGHFYDIVADERTAQGVQGGGTVHHIAFRTPSEEAQKAWQAVLRERALPVTPVRDRSYFKSIYFHEPGGVLFEIATDTPGFAIDESPDQLGRSLKLPRQYEPMRGHIERRLPPLRPHSETNPKSK